MVAVSQRFRSITRADFALPVATIGVRLWDASGKELKALKNGDEDMLEVAITHDGKRLIYGNWTGSVFNTPIDQPDAMVQLAANPEPAEKRVEQVKTTLVSVQQKLVPAKAKLDQALQAVVAANKPIVDLDAQTAALRKLAAESGATVKEAQQDSASFDQQLPAVTTAARDLQDEVTALRVSLKNDASKMIAVAEAEERLAGRLTEIAKQRRNRIAMQTSIKTHQQIVAARKAEADKLAATRGGLQKSLEQAQSLADAAKKAHDEFASIASKIQSKMDRLLAEIK